MGPIAIIDRGRGPELAGTRITVYDLIPYLEAGRGPTYIAALFRISTEKVNALIQYIEEHRDEVMAVHAKIEERIARGNPPWVEERLKGSRERLYALRDELRRKKEQEKNGERPVE
jgi:uncharacterized protein (DUF433 family)